MRFLLVASVLCLGIALHAQTQGNAPQLLWSVIDNVEHGGCGGGCINTPENINVNETIDVCVNAAAGSTYTVSDTLGNTWTQTSPTTTPTTSSDAVVLHAYTKSTFSGADTISISGTGSPSFNFIVAADFSNLGAVDGSVATATQAQGPSGLNNVTTSNTTTVNNDLLITCGGQSASAGTAIYPGTDGELLAYETSVIPNASPVMELKRVGAAGSNSVSIQAYSGGGGHGSVAVQTLAFKPVSTIAIADTALPDAASGVSYSAQLHCIGGTTTQTYSLFSGTLPTGITLNTSTGVLSGSSTVVGPASVQFKCTDGTNTSLAQSLTLTVRGGFNTPTVRNFVLTSWNSAGSGTSTSVAGVACGDVLLAIATGDDDGGSGFVQAVSGVNNFVKDSFNSPVARYFSPIPGTAGTSFPVVVYVIGPVTQSGTDIIQAQNNKGSSSGLAVLILDLSGAQGVIDLGSSFNSVATSGSGNFSDSYTSVVPNTLLLTASGRSSGGSPSFSVGLPFSNITSSSVTWYGSALIAAAGSTTATTSYSGTSAGDQYTNLTFGVRPEGSLCTNFQGQGERIKRMVF